jgi:hypothetical protein
MPRLIDPGAGEAITVDDLVEALDATPFDCRDEDAFASLGPLLARLGRNRGFLADLAIEELKRRCTGQVAANGYGAQVFLLRPPNGRYVLRANFWPAHEDPVVRASGPPAFFYDMPHDHNFPFLTYGYLGPGYWSDDYEYDVAALTGLPGELAGLRFVERSRLEPERLMLYRMRRDVHAQLPPDAFSVSLNILGSDPAQPWLDQYVFDLATGTIDRAITCTGAEALLTLAVQFGGNGADLAIDFARRHPCERMRVTALDALASATPGEAEGLLSHAAESPSAYLAAHARRIIAAQTAP